MRRVLFLLALIVAGCSPGAKDAAGGKAGNTVVASKPDAAAPVPEPPAALSVRSGVKGVHIVPTDHLPVWRDQHICGEKPEEPWGVREILRASKTAMVREGAINCADGDAPETPAGKAVADQGWSVISEATAHGYTAVSFANTLFDGVSSSTMLEDGDGYVALFRGRDLKALVSLAKGSHRAIGEIKPLASGDLRIFDGTAFNGGAPDIPFADLHFGPDGSVTVRKLRAESVCGGKAVVPNLYEIPINRARKLLRKAGWFPDPPTRKKGEVTSLLDGADFVDLGITEVEGCGGTGWGWCSFNYASKAGTLGVGTIDRGWPKIWPIVAYYEVKCH